MNAVEVSRACDELHQAVDEGPGLNPGVHAISLAIISHLRAAAAWDYPVRLLNELELSIASWFRLQSSSENEPERRNALLELISRIEDARERPRI
jgi:hypothetical protein